MPHPEPLFVHAARVRAPAPLEALARLEGGEHTVLRLVAGDGFRGPPWSFLAVDPVDVIQVGLWPRGRTLADVLRPLRPRPCRRRGPRLPFGGGWAGLIGYEARSGVEASPNRRRPPWGFRSLWLGRYDAVLAWNHRTGEAYASAEAESPALAEAKARDLARRVARGRPGRARLQTSDPTFRVSAARHMRAVETARQAILRGDLFQTNLSHRIEAPMEGPPRLLFERLVALQRPPYATWIDLGEGRAVLSTSPERFLRVRGRRVETDPMKGTRPRGATPAEDRRLRNELRDCVKEKAELAMIVDLCRNDLARVCEPGSVQVQVARRLLRFAAVHQAIGIVRGRLAEGLDRVDLLQAAFPPGSVTGAPKVRAMEILDALEREARGPYCGALGVFDTAGDMDLSVAIRTVIAAPGKVAYRVGGGITLRSDPEAEWAETLAKGRALLQALSPSGAAP